MVFSLKYISHFPGMLSSLKIQVLVRQGDQGLTDEYLVSAGLEQSFCCIQVSFMGRLILYFRDLQMHVFDVPGSAS